MVIHSGTYASCRHQFISNASLSWMVVNFFNQNPRIPSWRFPIWYFLVSFSVNWCVFPLSALLRALLFLLLYCLFIRFFFLFFFCYVLVAIFCSRIVQFPLHPVVGKCLHHLPQLGRIFLRCFGMSFTLCWYIF